MCPQVAVAVTVACNPDLNGNALPLYYFPRWPITRIRAVNNVSLGMLKVRYPIANPQQTPSMANNLGLMNAFCACCHQIGIVHLRNPLDFFLWRPTNCHAPRLMSS